MPRPQAQCQTLTLGQLAKRWGISRDHVRQLIEDGHLGGVFRVPSAGRYGAVTKIPLDSVLKAETENWAVTLKKPERARPRSSRRKDEPGPAFRHFPKLRRASLEQPASGSDGAAQD
jgi:hypothetical protein